LKLLETWKLVLRQDSNAPLPLHVCPDPYRKHLKILYWEGILFGVPAVE